MSDVNILISVQDAASNQIKTVEKNLDNLGRKSLNVSKTMQQDQENANRFYSKLDGDRLRENELLKKQEVKNARDVLKLNQQLKQQEVKDAREALKINVAIQAQIRKEAQATARAQILAAREAERAQQRQLGAVRDLLTSMQSMGRVFSGLLKGIGGGGLLGGWLGIRGYDFARESAQAEQVRLSFQRTFGSGAGGILSNVRNSVHGIVDDMTLMRQAIKTNIEGVSPDRLAQIFKLGAVASQRLGKTSEEGIELARKAIVEFDESALTELGILNKRDASYKTYLAILDKSTKGLGQYAKIQYQTNYVIDQMTQRFGKNWDVMNTNLQGFQLLEAAANNLKRTIGGLLNTAFGPMARHLGTWLTGIYELLANFDAQTGKSKVGQGLANILGPDGVESVRAMASSILSIIDGIKGFVSGVGSILKGTLDFIAKFVDISDKAGFNWEKIGKFVGEAGTLALLLLTPLGVVLTLTTGISMAVLSIYTTIKALQVLRGANLLGSILGQAAGGAGEAAAGSAVAAEAGAGGLGLGMGGIWTLPALAAAGATYANTQSAVDKINRDSGYTGSSSLSFFTPPSFESGPSVVATNPTDMGSTESLLAQINGQLSALNQKFTPINAFEAKQLGTKQ